MSNIPTVSPIWLASARYANMDFTLLSTLLPSIKQGITRVLMSYDTGCQWDKKLQTWISQYSTLATFKLSSLTYWKVVMPKFHLSGHGQSCQLGYNINYTKGAGHMCGEGIESGWSQLGNTVIWTWENSPNTHRAILDGHWGESNWQKLLRLHTSLPRCRFPRSDFLSRYFSIEESSLVSHMGQIPTRGRHLIVQKLLKGNHWGMGKNAWQVQQGPQEPKSI